MERTYLMVKPDGVERGLIGEVVARLEKKGLKLVGAKLMRIDEELATQHYAEHVGKPFFPDLLQFITSGPVFAMVWEGDEAVAIARLMMGKTNPLEAEQGTIRGDFAVHMNRNVIHGSDSVESAVREIGLFFKAEELLSYDKAIDVWL
ncbi:nucleoside-diphosphate kinase [Listeria newyorkensis]|uniref:Nucleoside diphosphate kinase n=1 Tax=Listeria newyorkensis TaxID=1497681 RepID=A0ABX4XNF0_9LIST|nr:nucleoside-diphosphate kinase [Listeria newyorkensis]KGL41050.1 nucleoside diphosphate kinase [Listeria newyorkensis]PNP91179.1 nucleoside-diphosphate kinase [Listeria newyorkensis]WAO21475.1 nucleoside-diphosphate kinase [Listeria newyorkensis]SQC58940.1 Nucleoside diphosphate kinase [Listeria newyorkensis]